MPLNVQLQMIPLHSTRFVTAPGTKMPIGAVSENPLKSMVTWFVSTVIPPAPWNSTRHHGNTLVVGRFYDKEFEMSGTCAEKKPAACLSGIGRQRASTTGIYLTPRVVSLSGRRRRGSRTKRPDI